MVPPAGESLNTVFQTHASEVQLSNIPFEELFQTLSDWEAQLKQLPPEDLQKLGDNAEEPSP